MYKNQHNEDTKMLHKTIKVSLSKNSSLQTSQIYNFFSLRKCVLVPSFVVHWASWGNLTLNWNLTHGGLLILESLEPTLEDLKSNDDGASSPEEPVESSEDGIGTCSSAN
jgi:hypothetical protein